MFHPIDLRASRDQMTPSLQGFRPLQRRDNIQARPSTYSSKLGYDSQLAFLSGLSLYFEDILQGTDCAIDYGHETASRSRKESSSIP